MATTQPAPTPSDAEMESSAPLETPAEDDGSYTIEIKVDASGGIQVGVETGAQEAAESEGEDGGQYQAVANIGEALRLVKDIYSNAGQNTSGAAAQEMGAAYDART